jgi:head-tail adaptor
VPVVAHGDRLWQVVIEGMVMTTGPSGFPIETWEARPPPMWCSRTAGPSTEIMAAGQLVARVIVEWRVAYRPDLDPALVDVPKDRRLIFAGRVFDVLEAETVGRRVQIRLVTREHVSGA